MTPPLKDDRAEFEAWYQASGSRQYARQERWEAWQAARASAPPAQAPTAQAVPPTRANVLAAGDGTPHRAVDYWKARALKAETAAQAVPSDALIESLRHICLYRHPATQSWTDAVRDALATVQPAQPKAGEWMPIASAPKDATPIDLWRDGERCVNMKRIDLGKGNVFYEPVESGPTCVRDATHWMQLPHTPATERAALAGQPAAQQGSTDTGSTP